MAIMRLALLALFTLLLAGCDVVKDRMGVKDPAKIEADAKAVGASCRLSGRSLEDCYRLNERQLRAGIYAGWREMNEYMIQRNMAEMPPAMVKESPPVEAPSEKAKDTTSDKDATKPKPDKEASKEPSKDIKPKLSPDLAKEAAKNKR